MVDIKETAQCIVEVLKNCAFDSVSDKQCICSSCGTLNEKYDILDEQAKIKGFKK